MKWLEKLNGNPIEWLIQSNPWTAYRTRIDLLDEREDSEAVQKAREGCLEDESIKQLINKTKDWMPKAPTRNNDPKISYFKLRMLADFGLKSTDKDIKEISDKATAHVENSLFACRGSIPEKPKKGETFTKPDPFEDAWHISPCNSPMITYSLLALGFRTEVVMMSVERLRELWEDETGWFCHLFFVEGQFKREKSGCPMAGLMALEVFSQIEDLKESQYAENAFAPLNVHKQLGKSLYYFGRSKKFWTFKYPFVWYNALYLGDVLSRFTFLKASPLLKECVDWIVGSQDEQGRFKPTSIFMPYKGWDFGNKKEPSPWITLLCCRILKRLTTSS